MSEHKCSADCKDYCYSCKRHEPLPPEYYRMCGECFHVFETEKGLVESHNALIRSMAVAVPGQDERPPYAKLGGPIWSCPLCLHDF